VTHPGARAAAVALAVAALLPGRARPDPLVDAERGAGRAEELLRSVEESSQRPDETQAERAAQKFGNGETQYLLGDWPHAALLMGEALDDATFRGGPQAATATFYLGDSLRQSGACGAGWPYLTAYLQGGEAGHRGEALGAALDCAMRLGHQEEVAPLLAEAERYHQGQLPPELRYLAAKAAYGRTDLSPEERFQRADAAFATVGTPYAQQAAYFQALLRIDRGDLAGAAERYQACAALSASDARQREAKDLCQLGLARVKAEQGDATGAIAAYGQVPIDSPYFDESLYEVASVHGRAGQLEPALHTAETLIELDPDSQLASRSKLLEGQLLLQQGKYENASQVYDQVITENGRVRDQLDAILTLHEDPVRYFADVLGQGEGGKAFDAAAAIPPPALRAALARPEVSRASSLMQALEAESHDVGEGKAMSERIEAALSGGGGLDAFPRLRQGYAEAQAVENAAAVLEGLAASAAVEAVTPVLGPADQAELARVHAERLVLEGRLDALPRTSEAARSRLDRWRARIDTLDRSAFQLGYQVEASRAAIAGTEVWLGGHREEFKSQGQQREGVVAELRKHREVVAGYDEELRRLRLEIALARDAAGGAAAMDEEAGLRADYLGRLAEERKVIDGARGRLTGPVGARLERVALVSDRLAATGARARALAGKLADEAHRRADALRARLAAEQAALATQSAALEVVQSEARGAVGQLAYRSFGQVRRAFYELVLRADVGLNDVAWTRKKDRLDRIQKLSQEQGEQLKDLEQRFRPALKEEE
jgi:tetratricopeptide (TPR) repeat protein